MVSENISIVRPVMNDNNNNNVLGIRTGSNKIKSGYTKGFIKPANLILLNSNTCTSTSKMKRKMILIISANIFQIVFKFFTFCFQQVIYHIYIGNIIKSYTQVKNYLIRVASRIEIKFFYGTNHYPFGIVSRISRCHQRVSFFERHMSRYINNSSFSRPVVAVPNHGTIVIVLFETYTHLALRIEK